MPATQFIFSLYLSVDSKEAQLTTKKNMVIDILQHNQLSKTTKNFSCFY